jgi:hypothetical protein
LPVLVLCDDKECLGGCCLVTCELCAVKWLMLVMSTDTFPRFRLLCEGAMPADIWVMECRLYGSRHEASFWSVSIRRCQPLGRSCRLRHQSEGFSRHTSPHLVLSAEAAKCQEPCCLTNIICRSRLAYFIALMHGDLSLNLP